MVISLTKRVKIIILKHLGYSNSEIEDLLVVARSTVRQYWERWSEKKDALDLLPRNKVPHRKKITQGQFEVRLFF